MMNMPVPTQTVPTCTVVIPLAYCPPPAFSSSTSFYSCLMHQGSSTMKDERRTSDELERQAAKIKMSLLQMSTKLHPFIYCLFC